MTSDIVKILLFIALLTIGSYVLNYRVNYYLKKMNINLNPEQLKELKWLVSSVVTILTGLSYMAYLVLSH